MEWIRPRHEEVAAFVAATAAHLTGHLAAEATG
jgi:thiamine pyrophosphate-dependent acetolactate synthase large subunit-like protein